MRAIDMMVELDKKVLRYADDVVRRAAIKVHKSAERFLEELNALHSMRDKSKGRRKQVLNNRIKRDYFLPDCVSYCYGPKKAKAGESGDITLVWNEDLRKGMERLGPIGKKSISSKCKNILGNCSEQHAANRTLGNKVGFNMSQLKFSKAIRPRTKREIPPCDNCKTIFGL